jgi:hypothetical protein
MLFEDPVDVGDVGQVHLVAAHLVEGLVDLGDDFLAALDGVVVGFVEVVGGCVGELDEGVRGQLADNAVRHLLGNVHLVVLHGGRTEQRHLHFNFS